jgi:hypothetical protein
MGLVRCRGIAARFNEFQIDRFLVGLFQMHGLALGFIRLEPFRIKPVPTELFVGFFE